MGYSNDYYGAFRITPKVDPLVACRLNLWLNSRHFNRYELKRELGEELNFEDETVFGAAGKNGEFVMPSFCTAWKNLRADDIDPFLAPHMIGFSSTDQKTDEMVQIVKNAAKTNRSVKAGVVSACADLSNRYYNDTPGKVYSLWSDLYIINDPNKDVSYLSWTGCEKSYHMDDWFRTIIGILQAIGHSVDGAVTEVWEDGYVRLFSMQDGKFTVTEDVNDAASTYGDEAEKAQRRSEKAAKGHVPEGEIDLSPPYLTGQNGCLQLPTQF